MKFLAEGRAKQLATTPTSECGVYDPPGVAAPGDLRLHDTTHPELYAPAERSARAVDCKTLEVR